MVLHGAQLPQSHQNARLFVTDGGLETSLIFHHKVNLRCFAAFELLANDTGRQHLLTYYRRYARIAQQYQLGFILETPTWRASQGWARQLGYSKQQLAALNRDAVALMVQLRREMSTSAAPVVISGCVGPRGDGYKAEDLMTEAEAEDYHAEQIATFSSTEVDMIAAITMTNVEEAVGVARAAHSRNLPVAISFTVETDGRLPSGVSLADAIEQVDATTQAAPAYYMINCAHPSHFESQLPGSPWRERIMGIRANASKCSHSELDEAPELDAGDPEELGLDYLRLRAQLPNLRILGGCCGTDDRHVAQICRDCAAA